MRDTKIFNKINKLLISIFAVLLFFSSSTLALNLEASTYSSLIGSGPIISSGVVSILGSSTGVSGTFSAPETVTDSSAYLVQYPKISVSGNKIYVVWQDSRREGDESSIPDIYGNVYGLYRSDIYQNTKTIGAPSWSSTDTLLSVDGEDALHIRGDGWGEGEREGWIYQYYGYPAIAPSSNAVIYTLDHHEKEYEGWGGYQHCRKDYLYMHPGVEVASHDTDDTDEDSFNYLNPQIVKAASGTYYIVFLEDNSPNDGVAIGTIKLYYGSGSSWNEIPVDTHSKDPAIALDNDGNVYVMYVKYSWVTSRYNIYFKMYSHSGQFIFRGQIGPSDSFFSNPSLVFDSNDDLHSIFVEYDGSNYKIHYYNSHEPLVTFPISYCPTPLTLLSHNNTLHLIFGRYNTSNNEFEVVYKYKIGDSEWSSNQTIASSSYPMYPHAALDNSGNLHIVYISGYNTISYRYEDNTPPSAPTSVKANGKTSGYINSSSLTISWDAAEDSLSGIAAYDVFDSSDTTKIAHGITGTNTTVSLSDGTYTIFVRAYDNAGNYTDSDSITITVDTSPPTINNAEVIKNPDDKYTFYANASDTVSGIYTVKLYYKKSTDPDSSYSSNKENMDQDPSYTGIYPRYKTNAISLDDTLTYNWKIEAKDIADNIITSEVYSLTVDTTNPVIEITSPEDGSYSTSSTITLVGTATDNGSGIKMQASGKPSIFYKLNQEVSWSSFSFTSSISGGYRFVETIRGFSEGSHTFYVTAIDNEDNQPAEPKSRTFIVDATPPTINSFQHKGESSNKPRFSYSVEDTTSRVTSLDISLYKNETLVTEENIYSNNSGARSISGEKNLSTALTSGMYVAVLTATDKAGNVSTSSPLNFSHNTLEQPTNLEISKETGQLKLTWDISGDLSSGEFFRVYRSSDNGASWEQRGDNLTEKEDNKYVYPTDYPNPGSHYLYRVVSANSELESEPSNVVAAYRFDLGAGITTSVTFPNINNNDLNTLKEVAERIQGGFPIQNVGGDIISITHRPTGIIYQCYFNGTRWIELDSEVANTTVESGNVLEIGVTKSIELILEGAVPEND